MRITDVQTAKRYGRFVSKEGGPNLIDIEWDSDLPKASLRDKRPMVYLFVVQGEIRKIGGSADRSGIVGMIGFYKTAMQGSPGPARFILHHLIARELDRGNSVELFVIRSAAVKAQVPGLFGTIETEVHPFKEMETACVADYFESEGVYPEWNFQEAGLAYPNDLSAMFNQYHENRLKARSAK
jgi:hypothetical protein